MSAIIPVQVDDASSAISSVLAVGADGNWDRAIATALTSTLGLAIAMAGTAGAGTKQVIFAPCFWQDVAWSWNPGKPLYVSPSSAGALTETAPSGAGEFSTPVAVAMSATVIRFMPISFTEVP